MPIIKTCPTLSQFSGMLTCISVSPHHLQLVSDLLCLDHVWSSLSDFFQYSMGLHAFICLLSFLKWWIVLLREDFIDKQSE